VRAASARIGELLQELVEELKILEALRDEGPEGEDRAENVKELIAGALDFDAEVEQEAAEEGEMDGFSELDLYLQRVALVADIDKHDRDADAVTMMTLHNAKGLEFPVVFIAGLEDGLFPLSRSYDDPEEMEEERRLFYVGITRAENKLYLAHARQRRRAGEMMYGRLSPFAEAIPAALLERKSSQMLQSEGYTTPHRDRRERFQEKQQTGFVPDDDFEPGYDQDAPRLVKGERVVHPTFGSGKVVEVSGFGPDVRVTVEFEAVGRKKLVARYAGLKKDYF
jgi:DNA helicase II / ATP-dependent DNA helicase PcrA